MPPEYCLLYSPCLQVKSYLTGNPAIAIALNDSLVIGRREGGQNDYGGYGRCASMQMPWSVMVVCCLSSLSTDCGHRIRLDIIIRGKC